MIGLFRTLIVFGIIYLVIRFFTRYLLPIFVGSYVNQKASESQNNSRKEEPSKREGEITINYSSQSKKHLGKDQGEYVDFEEIKE
jgi:hypothetical protein